MVLLAGCSTGSVKSVSVVPATPVMGGGQQAQPVKPLTPSLPPVNAQTVPVAQCQQTLDALKQVNTTAWRKDKAAFDSLLRAAAQYGDVRNGVSGSIRGTVDAMYQFRINKLCGDIERDLMVSLVKRGEAGS